MPFEHSAESFAVPIEILEATDERFGRDGVDWSSGARSVDRDRSRHPQRGCVAFCHILSGSRKRERLARPGRCRSDQGAFLVPCFKTRNRRCVTSGDSTTRVVCSSMCSVPMPSNNRIPQGVLDSRIRPGDESIHGYWNDRSHYSHEALLYRRRRRRL